MSIETITWERKLSVDKWPLSLWCEGGAGVGCSMGHGEPGPAGSALPLAGAVQLHKKSRAGPVTVIRVSHQSSDRETRFTVTRQVQGQAGKSQPWVRLQSSEVHSQPQAWLQHSSDKDQKLCLSVLKCSSQVEPEGPSYLQLLLTQRWQLALSIKPPGRRDEEDTTRCPLCLYRFS